jgi:hypothetical protein
MDLSQATAVYTDRADLAEALVREGCVGETLAAIECAARAATCTIPAVREILDTIVADEARHAALAWRTLRWLLQDDPAGEVRQRIATVMAELRGQYEAAEAGPTALGDARAHGLLTNADIASSHARAWSSVIGPSWSELTA